jgi:hypothetical protein
MIEPTDYEDYSSWDEYNALMRAHDAYENAQWRVCGLAWGMPFGPYVIAALSH